MSLLLEPLSTSVFVLSDLMPGSMYWYEHRVKNSSGAQIGESVTGQFTAMRPPTFPPIALPTPTPDMPTDTGTYTCMCTPVYIWRHFQLFKPALGEVLHRVISFDTLHDHDSTCRFIS